MGRAAERYQVPHPRPGSLEPWGTGGKGLGQVAAAWRWRQESELRRVVGRCKRRGEKQQKGEGRRSGPPGRKRLRQETGRDE